MKATFYMSDLGLLHYYLGMEVKQLAYGITLGLRSEDPKGHRAD